ncbi:pentapeptide repeat-containing protein [Streptomyces europaeiscabiei]|uniref:pentapeptide repeat-containing protein n=1 Tax=Streptomyces europaeiscabiei TaxID=146819 RepID=UPI0029B624E8|nr:pentapeptide repeat-containing protein [Streptomyces europaeiscabiei]MDX3848515.1 pentapeptide repeat-containing protein [Streptomyces europaeiscabiei]
MSPRLLLRQSERHESRMWPVGIVLPVVFTTAALVAGVVFYVGWNLLGARELQLETRVDSKTLLDLVKVAFGVVAGAGGLVALVVAYRRQRVTEDGALRDATRLHTERFTTAVSQLGEDSAAVRFGGIHALAGLADDAPTRELRQTCIDVLCAYLRLPYVAEAELPEGVSEARFNYLALREVRRTTIRLIRDHLRLPPNHHQSWQGHSFDFTNVVFDGGDLGGAVFSGGAIHFHGASFVGKAINFSGAVFSGATVNFGGAAHLGGADFAAGDVNFSGAAFSGGTVTFNEAVFSGATVRFNGATFSSAVVDFSGAQFNSGVVDFSEARGPAPLHLVPEAGSPIPGPLILAESWQTAGP